MTEKRDLFCPGEEVITWTPEDGFVPGTILYMEKEQIIQGVDAWFVLLQGKEPTFFTANRMFHLADLPDDEYSQLVTLQKPLRDMRSALLVLQKDFFRRVEQLCKRLNKSRETK